MDIMSNSVADAFLVPGMSMFMVDTLDIDNGSLPAGPAEFDTLREPLENMLQIEDFFFKVRPAFGESLLLLHVGEDATESLDSTPSAWLPDVERKK